MKKIILLLFLANISVSKIFADEGMWLPSLIKERVSDMQKKGFRLTSEDIYSINQACLKDAIVHFGSGCTGNLVSSQGLIITNHHCGFSQIQAHSSVEHDYLKDGFWAMNQNEELPNKGLSVRFLIRMEDVTEAVLKSYISSMTEEQRSALVAGNSADIINNATKDNNYEAAVEALYYGNQYFLFVYEVFTDVRLVGAPPSSIGKFGGDTDNWMWPRHTGDFSIFRIYANKENKPAKYSKDNVPYKPKKFFTVSVKGVKENDFTLVYGYPGRTQEYIISDAVRYIANVSNPHKIKLRTLRLEIQADEMSKSAEVRIKYASKNASVSNSWKKWQGETMGITKKNIVQNKKEFEAGFTKWAQDKAEFNTLLDQFKKLYAELEPYSFANDYLTEAVNANEIIKFAGSFHSAVLKESKSPVKNPALLMTLLDDFYKDYYQPVDKRSFVALISEYRKNIHEDFQPGYFKAKMKEFDNPQNFADFIFSESILTNKDSLRAYIKESPDISRLERDPAVEMYLAFNKYYNDNIRQKYDQINKKLTLLYRTYMKAIMEYDKTKSYYPDANSTLRVAYGKIMGYKPNDAVYYKHVSTLEGIMEKDNPAVYDYNIPQKLRDIYKEKEYGEWEENGTVPVCFIATNHTSGGNSGSPVLNAKGQLIGLNFDRVWEGTMSDIAFDPQMCRNISLDIRYVLFVIDKVAGAGHLIKEMNLIR
ncbi:MAG: S46 family peptidase [Bacteroidales bacterium]|jgi:hypothetical protein